MGRTDTNASGNRIPSPVKHYISFGGETGVFSYWDKENKKNIPLEDLDMVVMDIRSSVGGWSDENQCKIFSNYFKSTKDQVRVKVGDKDLITGTYAADKDKIKSMGGKFQTNIFALADINGSWVPISFQITGSSLAAWTSFNEENKIWDIYKSLLVVRRSDNQQKKGRVLFYTPVFSLEALPDDLAAKADDVYANMVKPYLEQDIPEVAVT